MLRSVLLVLGMGLTGLIFGGFIIGTEITLAQPLRSSSPRPNLPVLPLEGTYPQSNQPDQKSQPPQPALPQPEYIVGSGFVVGRQGLVLTSSALVRGHNCPVDDQPMTVPIVAAASQPLSLPALNQRVQPSIIQVFSKLGDCQVTLKLPNGQLYPAKVLRFNPEVGVALVAAQRPVVLPPLPVCGSRGDNSVSSGEDIAVFGSAYGLPVSMSTGIINAVRPLAGFAHVQFDAPTNRGVVGGPILDRRGQVLAIFTRDHRINHQGLTFGAMLPQVLQALNLHCGG